MTNKQTNKQTALWRIISIFFLIPFSLILTLSCNKNDPMEMSSSLSKVEHRSANELNTTELKSFQTSLKNLRDNVPPSTYYTIEEATYGIETLINIKYSEHSADYDTRFLRDTFFFDPINENYYDLFLKSKSNLESLALENNIVGLSLEEVKNENGIRLFYATTITSGGNTPLGPGLGDSCEIVFHYNGMYMGSHHLDIETGEIVITKHPCNVDPECGSIGLSNGRLKEPVASSEIGRRLTSRKVKPIEEYCIVNESNLGPKPKFINNRIIGVADFTFEEMKHLNECYRSLSGEVTPCDCILPFQLNDIYNIFKKEIDDLMENQIQYIYPYHVLNSVLTWGTTVSDSGLSDKDSNVRINCVISIAEPQCVYVDDGNILEMEFNF